MEAVEKLRRLLRQRLGPENVPYAMIACDEVLEEIRAPRFHPEIKSAWVAARQRSPSRAPYSDAELADLRVFYDPFGSEGWVTPSREAVVIWTLLDMLEEQRGWKP